MADYRALVIVNNNQTRINDSDRVIVGAGIVTTTGTLGITGANGIQFQNALSIDNTSSNVSVMAGATLGTLGTGNINLPNNVTARFKIEGTAVANTVTAAALATLTAGISSNADALHTHAGLGNLSKTFSRNYPLAAGAHDFTGDSTWADPNYPDTEDTEVTGLLGDGVDTPKFWVTMPSQVFANGVTRTAANRLRIKPDGTNTGVGELGVTGPAIAFAIEACELLSLQCTIRMEHFDNLERVQFGFLRLKDDSPGATPVSYLKIVWEPSNPTTVGEQLITYGNSVNTADISSYISSGIVQRHYRFESNGFNNAVFGGAVGNTSTANTLIKGRSSPLVGSGGRLVFFLTPGTLGVPEVGYYAELADLTINGTRVVF
jgi:hypothetical protein